MSIVLFPVKADFLVSQNDTKPLLEGTLLNGDGTVVPLFGTGAACAFSMLLEQSAIGTTPTVNNASCAILNDLTFTAASSVYTNNAHGLVTNSPVMLTTTGTLPAGLKTMDTGTVYYVVNVTTNTFQLATTPNGTAVATTDNGSGVFTLVRGRVRYSWAAADTATAGQFWGQFKVTFLDGTIARFPNGDGKYIFIRVEQSVG